MSGSVVLLDGAGTLFTERISRDEIYARVLADFGTPQTLDAVARLRAEIHDAMPELHEGAPRYSEGWFREFVRRLLRRIDSGADAEAVRATLAAHFMLPENFVVYGDVPPALDALQERGARLAVVSNWNERLPELLAGLGIERAFELVLASAAFGRSKPDPAIFREALRRLDARPGDAVHVGDHPVKDVMGARRAGLRAILLDRSRTSAGEPDVIGTLAELPDLLPVG